MRLEEIARVPTVLEARAEIHRRDDETMAEQLRIVRIPAPTGLETHRARYVAGRFEGFGLEGIASDEVGNVIATLPAARPDTVQDHGAPIILSAHLDTIFPDGTVISPRNEGGRIHAPGITDNSRGVAALLRIAETLVGLRIRTRRPIVFIATVGEEGLGDLRGVKHLFAEGSPFRSAAGFISLDGAGTSRIIHRAVGSRRLRMRITGPGGHSWGDRGLPSPAFALGMAVGRLAELVSPKDPGQAVNVGRMGGGTSVNAIPAEVWCEVDLRATEADRLAKLERRVREIFEIATRAESQRGAWGFPLACTIDPVGERPSGETPIDDHLVRSAIAATRLIGIAPELVASSTDANVPMSIGIPAITVGAGGRGGGVHTHAEWYENHEGARGIERALLITLAAAGIRSADQASVASASAVE